MTLSSFRNITERCALNRAIKFENCKVFIASEGAHPLRHPFPNKEDLLTVSDYLQIIFCMFQSITHENDGPPEILMPFIFMNFITQFASR